MKFNSYDKKKKKRQKWAEIYDDIKLNKKKVF